MKGKTWDISALEQLEEAAREILTDLKATSNGASVLALSGDLGAGKTTFTQSIGRLLGVEESLTSPTFVIMKKYLTTDDHFKQLIHIDAYRLSSPEELRVLGFASDLLKVDHLVVVEWADKLATLLPPTAMKLHFNLDGARRTLSAI